MYRNRYRKWSRTKFRLNMNQKEITKIVNKVYPLIRADYNSTALVDFHKNIYERLDGIPAIDGYVSCAEYSWDENKIFLYTNHLDNEEDIIRSLIHECVHSTQLYDIYEAYYKCGLDYSTHPYEIEAEYEEEKWINYKINK